MTAIVVNPPESKLAKRTSVHCSKTIIFGASQQHFGSFCFDRALVVLFFCLVIHDIASSNKLHDLPNKPRDHVGTFCHYLQCESVLKSKF